jgi:hypothetical protein
VGAHSRVRSIGNHAFEAGAVSKFAFESVHRIGHSAFQGSDLKAFSGHVDVWGFVPFDNCRGLHRLEMWPGLGFDPLRLVGHIPGYIRFHSDSKEAKGIFENLLHGSS